MLPIFEYCCLNWFCRPCQSVLIGLNDSYHNLVSPTNVRQNLWTFRSSGNWWLFIQSLVLSKCAYASSFGFPENSGLKYDQFKWTIHCACCVGCCWAWGATGTGTSGASSPHSAIFCLSWFYYVALCSILFYSIYVLVRFFYTITLSHIFIITTLYFISYL